MVSGDYGFAEALRALRPSVIEWLSDDRPSVQEFAKRHIAKLDLMIADELRRAESEKEMFNRSFDTPDGETNDGDAEPSADGH